MGSKKIDYVRNVIKRVQSTTPEYYHNEIRKQLQNWMVPMTFYKYNFVNNQQIGGDNIYKEFYQTYKDYKFKALIEKSQNDIVLSIQTHEDNPSNCAVVIVNLEDNTAILQGLSHYENCTKPYIEYGKGGGSIILKFVLGFLRKNKDTLKIKRLLLKDNATKDCINCAKKIKISELYFLMNIDTWCGSYGFLPYNPSTQSPDDSAIARYRKNQKILKKIKTKDVPLIRYMEEAINKHEIKGIDIKLLKPLIEKNGDIPFSLTVKTLMKTYDAFCCIFTHIIDRIYDKLRLASFYTYDFYLDL